MRNPRLNAASREAVLKVAKKLSPEPIRKWSVVIGSKEFPVKQIVKEAANALDLKAPPVTPADFIAHDAVRILRRLGFEKEIRYYG